MRWARQSLRWRHARRTTATRRTDGDGLIVTAPKRDAVALHVYDYTSDRFVTVTSDVRGGNA